MTEDEAWKSVNRGLDELAKMGIYTEGSRIPAQPIPSGLLRDYFAGLAMQALVTVRGQQSAWWFARESYVIADAMMREAKP